MKPRTHTAQHRCDRHFHDAATQHRAGNQQDAACDIVVPVCEAG